VLQSLFSENPAFEGATAMRFISSYRSKMLRFQQGLAIVLMLAMLGNSTAFAGRVLLDAVSAKQVLTKRGVGKLVRITESDGTNITGMLTALHDDTFEVTPKSDPTSTTISYAQVTEVHNDKSPKAAHSTGGQGREIAVIVVVVGAAVAVIVFFATHFRPVL
jgi:hypothetical protein